MSGADKREAKRVAHLCEVECEGQASRRLESRINDLSSTGAFVDSIVEFPQGTMVRLKFKLAETPMDVNAEVRYSMPGVGIGVRFVDLTPEQQARLDEFVASN